MPTTASMVGSLALVIVLSATSANPYLEQAKKDFGHLEYARCAEHLHLASSLSNTPEDLVALEIYGGLCAFSLRKEEEAAEHFRLALQLDREAELPALVSPKIRELFAKIRSQLPPEPLKTPPEPKPETKPPPTDTPVVAELTPPPKEPEAKIDVAPPAEKKGKSRVIPISLAAVGVAAGALGAYFGLNAQNLLVRSQFTDHFESDAKRDYLAAQDSANAANVSYGIATAALIAAGVTWLLDVGAGSPESK